MGTVCGQNISCLLAKWPSGINLAFGFGTFRTRKLLRTRINRSNINPSTASPINVLKRIGGVTLFSRHTSRSIVDESALKEVKRTVEYGVEYRNAVFYAATPEEAIRGLKRQLASRTSQDDELLTLQSGLAVGLAEDCIRQFCTDNDLDATGGISRRDLRKLVLQRRALNCVQYRVGLAKVKVFLNCK